jgi:hypothetical protein
LTLGRTTTAADVDRAAEVLVGAVRRLRTHGSSADTAHIGGRDVTTIVTSGR